MPNKRWNSMHGPDDKSGGGASNAAKGSKSLSGSEKVANWPGLPGKTQGKARNAGQPKKGWKGTFYVKSEGL